MMCVYAGFSTIENGLRLQQENLCYPHGSISCSCELLKWVIKRLDLHQFFKDLLIYFLKDLFIFDCAGSSLLPAGFLLSAGRGATLGWGARASHCSGFSSWGAQALGLDLSSCSARTQRSRFKGSWALAQLLWHRGLVVPTHLGSSKTRDWTHFPCIGRLIRNHWITREALAL